MRAIKGLSRSGHRENRTDRSCLLRCERPNEVHSPNPPKIHLAPRDRCSCPHAKGSRRSACLRCSHRISNLLPIPKHCRACREGQTHWQGSFRPAPSAAGSHPMGLTHQCYHHNSQRSEKGNLQPRRSSSCQPVLRTPIPTQITVDTICRSCR